MFDVYLLLQGDRTALMYASWGGHLECVQALLGREDADFIHQDEVSSTKAGRCLLLICVLVVCVTRESDK